MTQLRGYPEDRPPTADERRRFWDERYAGEGWVFGLEPNQFVQEFFADRAPGRLLDLGCGQGRNALWLASRGYDVTGVDLSVVAVEQAAQLAEQCGAIVSFEAHDLSEWHPEPASFDYVVLSYLQLHAEDRRRVHAMVRDALAPGGTVFVIAHHADNIEHGFGGPQLPDVLFDERQLEADFAGFDVIRSGPVLREVDHDGATETAIDVVFAGIKPSSG